MPTFYVVVGTNCLFVDAPVLWCKDSVLDPLAFHVDPEGAVLGSVHSVERTSVRSREMARMEGPSAS